MTEQNPNIDERTKRAADLALMRRQISRASYAAILAGTLTLAEAKALGRDQGPDTTWDHSGPGRPSEGPERASAEDHRGGADKPPQPVSRISKNDTQQFCWCGCEQLTSPGKRWLPGHDQRGKGIIKRAAKEDKVDELDVRLREYGEERGLI
jgi:hypothetical protein